MTTLQIQTPKSKIQNQTSKFTRNIDKTSDSNARHLVIEGIKIPNPRSHDFGNALWHHRNIDKTSESRHLVYHKPKSKISRFANALWHHRNIDKTSGSRPLVVEGIKIPNPRSTKIIKNPRSKIQDSTSKNPRLTNIKKCNSSRADSFWSVVAFLCPLPRSLKFLENRYIIHQNPKSTKSQIYMSKVQIQKLQEIQIPKIQPKFQNSKVQHSKISKSKDPRSSSYMWKHRKV